MKTKIENIGNVCEQIRGISYTKNQASKDQKEGLIPILRAGNIKEGKLNTDDDLVYVPNELINSKQRLKLDDVLIAASSGSIEVVGKAGRLSKQWDGSFGTFCKCLRPNPQKVFPPYFYHFFQTEFYRRRISFLAQGANINNLRNEDLNGLKIPLPPIDEQRRIAKTLDKVEKTYNKLKKKVYILQNLPYSLFENYFQIKNSLLGIEYKKIEDISEIQGGLQVSHKRKNLPFEIPYLRVANVYRGYLNLLEIKNINCTDKELQRTELKKGDLLVVEGHGNPLEIGRVAVWNEEIKKCVHQNHLIRIRPDSKIIKSEFLSFYLNSHIGRRSLLKSAKTTSGLNTISSKQVKEVKVPIYKIKDQENFVRKISYIKSIEKKFEIQLDKFIELKNSLNQELLGT